MGPVQWLGRVLMVLAGVVVVSTAALMLPGIAGGPDSGSTGYRAGADGHPLHHATGIQAHRPGDPAGARFDDYDPASYGWRWMPPSRVGFRYHGHTFRGGVVNADVAVIFTRILDVIVPKMREPLCQNRDCWGFVTLGATPGKTRSFLGYGLALDINASSNSATSQPISRYDTTLPLNTGALIRRYGAEWGGDWADGLPHDPMHIELHLSPAAAARVAAAIRADRPLPTDSHRPPHR